ncbi:MAG: hypothetical protein ACQESK_02790 [Bacteroidota bacterium]
MSNNNQQLELLEINIKKLITGKRVLETENKQLVAQIGKMNKDLNELAKEIDSLKKANRTLKTANAILGSNEHKRETKLKINSLIKEIDHCIVQLTN